MRKNLLVTPLPLNFSLSSEPVNFSRSASPSNKLVLVNNPLEEGGSLSSLYQEGFEGTMKVFRDSIALSVFFI